MLFDGPKPYIYLNMRYGLLFCFLFAAFNCLAQDKTVQGIVFDKATKERIASVNIHNTTKGFYIYDNLKGEYTVVASVGDQLIFTRQDYLPDTIKVTGKGELAIYLTHVVIQLREVTVRDSILTPDQKLAQTKEEYAKIYSPSLNPDAFVNSSYGGAGISIDAIYNAISRSGRNAAHLRDIIQQDYQQNVIDYRFSRTFVSQITGLKEQELTSGMYRYRPAYYNVTTMTDYEFIRMIKANYRRYVRYQRVYAPQPLTR
jgi:hypothetical protein